MNSSAKNPPQRKAAKRFAKSFPQKNSFCKTESAFRLATLPEYLEGRTPKEKHTFFFQRKSHPRQIRNARSVFSFGVAEALRGSGGAIHSSSGLVSKKVRILYNEYRRSERSEELRRRASKLLCSRERFEKLFVMNDEFIPNSSKRCTETVSFKSLALSNKCSSEKC